MSKLMTWEEYLDARGDMPQLNDEEFQKLFNTALYEMSRRMASRVAYRMKNGRDQGAMAINGNINCYFYGGVKDHGEVEIHSCGISSSDTGAKSFRDMPPPEKKITPSDMLPRVALEGETYIINGATWTCVGSENGKAEWRKW